MQNSEPASHPNGVCADVTEELNSLPPGGHVCLIYERDPAEQMPVLLPFIKAGLNANEKFVYIADDQTVEQLSSHLRGAGINVEGEVRLGRLALWTRKEWRQPGDLDSARKAEQVRTFVRDAREAGFSGIRFAVEMTWTLNPDIEPEKLEHWEATLNTLFDPSFPARIVCQYNRSRLDPRVLMAGLHTHPDIILGKEVCSNPFFEAPLILKSNGNGKPDPEHRNGAEAPARKHDAGEAARSERNRVNWMIRQLAVTRDVTVQRAVQDSWRFLAAVVENSDDAIITKDLNGFITSWNKGAERLFGYTAHEVVGKHISLLIPEGKEDEEPAILAQLRAGKRIDHYETARRRKDGALLDISITVSPVRNAEGKIIGASKIARDVTERKRMERELKDAHDKLARANEDLEQRVRERTASLHEALVQMEEFSYSVSHDLRAPVRAMRGYATALVEDYGSGIDARARDYLDRIIRSSGRMERLIHDILTYSRVARAEVRILPVSLKKLIPEIIQQYPEMQPPSAEILIREPLLPVLGHEPSLTQALSNLLGNAVKFVARGTTPKIHVWTELRGSCVRLWIEDNGIGIRPEYQSRLFGMFERVHQDQQYHGTGIGLAIVRKAIEKIGGRVGVESDGISGSSFWIELPQADPQEPHALPAAVRQN
ncbi:MAG TPA: MEDS domain-containing protein [Verrucomicrobiae bacterium]|nr:MEDS domain-containing protein [Verrucomicrobiae bacterium]